MIRGLTFEPLIPPALWIALAIISAALFVWYGWNPVGAMSRSRWFLVVGLMATGSAAVLLILLNPLWIEPIAPPAGKPVLTILTDASGSMNTDDIAGNKTRYSEAARIAKVLAKDLGSQFEVRVQNFSDSVTPVELSQLSKTNPDGQITDLAAAIVASMDDDRPQGQAVFLLSDGIHNGPGGIASLLNVLKTTKAMSIPVYTKTLGGDVTLNDVEVTIGRPQELSFVGQNVPMTVVLRQRGQLNDRANVVLIQDGKEIDRKQAGLVADDVTTVRFDVKRGQAGLYRYEVRLEALPGEASLANNNATMLLRVVEEPIKVLLLEGKPYWDGKFLMRTLSSDPSLELDAIVRLSDSRYLQRTLRLNRTDRKKTDVSTTTDNKNAEKTTIGRTESTKILDNPQAFLSDPDVLKKYQVVVLGRDSENFLSEELVAKLKTWISRDGGSLVCYRGSPVARINQELSRLMPVLWKPVRESRFRMSMTDRGSSLNWLIPATGSDESVLDKLPSLATQTQPGQPKPLAVVLARSEKSDESAPVISYQPYGTGRVVVIEGSGMWRWAFLAPQFQKHDAIYGALWQSLLRWLVSSVGLVPGQNMVLRSEKVKYSTEESVSALLLMREEATGDAIPKIELFDSQGKSIKIETPVPLGDEPGVYRVIFGKLPEGQYRSNVVTPRKDADTSAINIGFDVRQQFREQLEVSARPDIMARIANDSGGAVIVDPEPGKIAEQFQEHISRSRPQRVFRLSAWDRWWVLMGIFLVWGTAWGMRRAGGLV